jgi:hypothetical protein
MRVAPFLALILVLSGCAGSVTRPTPEALRAAPGSSASFTTPKGYDMAYRKVLEQMKSCYERKLGILGTSQTTVFGDKSANEAQVSMAFSAITGYRVITTIVLTPLTDGTAVKSYYASETPLDVISTALKGWLISDTSNCPGDTPSAPTNKS